MPRSGLRYERLLVSFFLALFVLPAAPAYGQLIEKHGVRMGVATSRPASEFSGAVSRTGLQAGVFAERDVSSILSLQVGLEYARRGNDYSVLIRRTEDGEDIRTELEQALDYLTVPFLARARVFRHNSIIPYALVGPRLDVLINEAVVKKNGEPISQEDPPENGPQGQGTVVGNIENLGFRTLSASGVIGVGLAIRGFLGGEVRFEGRRGFGLTESDYYGRTWKVWNVALVMAW